MIFWQIIFHGIHHHPSNHHLGESFLELVPCIFHIANVSLPGSSKGCWMDDKGCPYTIPWIQTEPLGRCVYVYSDDLVFLKTCLEASPRFSPKENLVNFFPTNPRGQKPSPSTPMPRFPPGNGRPGSGRMKYRLPNPPSQDAGKCKGCEMFSDRAYFFQILVVTGKLGNPEPQREKPFIFTTVAASNSGSPRPWGIHKFNLNQLDFCLRQQEPTSTVGIRPGGKEGMPIHPHEFSQHLHVILWCFRWGPTHWIYPLRLGLGLPRPYVWLQTLAHSTFFLSYTLRNVYTNSWGALILLGDEVDFPSSRDLEIGEDGKMAQWCGNEEWSLRDEWISFGAYKIAPG